MFLTLTSGIKLETPADKVVTIVLVLKSDAFLPKYWAPTSKNATFSTTSAVLV